MIPRDYITEWRARAPWPSGAQVEQDFVLSRALVERFEPDRALREGRVDPVRVVEAFGRYMEAESHAVGRAEFERNLAAKLEDPVFTEDVGPLLAPDVTYDATAPFALVHERLIARLDGDPWRRADP